MNLRTVTLNPWGALPGFRDLQREMSRLLESVPGNGNAARFPLVNVLADRNGAVLTAEIPGLEPGEIEINLLKNQLTIGGTIKRTEPEGEGVTCLRNERASGSFSRTFTLPFEVEEGDITAKYDKGVLEVTLPRAEKSKPRTIQVIAG
jgi:HSP20 family protein